MSTALVASTMLAPATARVAQARVGDSTSFTSVDPTEGSHGTQPGDQAILYDQRWQDLHGQEQPPIRYQHNRPVQFGGIFVTREVGTAIMQAQAQASLSAGKSVPEAERQIRIYEFNQALAGTPEVSTNVGLTR